MTTVGQRIRRVEDPRLVQGAGQYVSDLRLPDLLHAGFVRSPHAHARVRSVDLTAVRDLPGVIAAYSAADLPELAGPVPANAFPPGLKAHGFSPLATDTVRYVGEPVAVVLVEDPYLLEDAVDAAMVDYEPLPAVTDVEGAIDGAPAIWPDAADNVAGGATVGTGDVDAAFREAEAVVEGRFVFPRAAGAAMEPRAVAARAEGDALTIWDATQAPHNVRSALAGYFELPEEKVRVITPDVGGGFGPKGRVYPEAYVVAALARRQGRPVRFVATRNEDLLTTFHGRGQVHRARLAARSDGAILGLDDQVLQDAGAYTPNGLMAAMNTTRHLMGPYQVPAIRVRVQGVYTTRVPMSPLRGGGRPEGIFVVERLLDRLAHRLGIDRAEIRRRNFIPPEAFPYDTHFPSATGTVIYDSGNYPAYLSQALRAIDYESFRCEQEAARREGRYLGLGLVAFIESTGVGPETASLEIGEDGTVRVAVGSPDNGQGHATTFAQMAAQRLGASLDAVEVTGGDTGTVHQGTGTFASRMGQSGGNAVSLAAQAVREKALRLAADMLEISPHDLQIEGGRISVRGLAERGLTLGEVAREAVRREDPLAETTTFSPEHPATWAGGANAAIVEVDVETGKVTILRYVVVHDSGTIVNPTIVEGQVHGGVAHGTGNALYERMVYGEDGQLLTGTFADYTLPGPGDVPTVEIIHMETPSPFNPEGIKGAGEGGTIGGIPTIVSAVEDALSPFGVQIDEMPLTPEVVVRLMEQTTSTAQPA